METGVLKTYGHQGLKTDTCWRGPLEGQEYEQVMSYYKWLWDIIKLGGLASYSHRLAVMKWHVAARGNKSETREFYARYSKPQIFIAVNPDLFNGMRKDISKNDGPPHQVEQVLPGNGLVNMRLYFYGQLDGKTPKGTRVHVWWPGQVYFDYQQFLQEHGQWTMDCSVIRENELQRIKKIAGRKYSY